MEILSELTALVTSLGLPVETGFFSGKAPDEYVVLTPMVEEFTLHCDNAPQFETQEVRISLYSKGNYLIRKRQIVKSLLQAGFTVTSRRYIGREDDTRYYHQTIDCEQLYGLE